MATKIRGGNIGAGAIDEIEDNLEARIAKPDNVKIRKAISNLVDSDYVSIRIDPSSGSAAAGTVKISNTDTSSLPLQSKIVEGTEIKITKNNAGGSETLSISAPNIAAFAIALGG